MINLNTSPQPSHIEEIIVDSVDSASRRVYARGINGGRRLCVMLSTTPVHAGIGAGDLSLPERGTRGLGVALGGYWFILGWYSPLNVLGHSGGLEGLPTVSPGDIVVKGKGRSFLYMSIAGLIRLFSDSWASIGLSKTLQKLTVLVKRLYIRTRGGKISWTNSADTDQTSLHVEVHRQYEQDTLSDGRLGTTETNSNLFNPSVNISSADYVDKFICDVFPSNDGKAPVSLETRQAPLGGKNKTHFTHVSFGWLDDVAFSTGYSDTTRQITYEESFGTTLQCDFSTMAGSLQSTIGSDDFVQLSYTKQGQGSYSQRLFLASGEYQQITIQDSAGQEVLGIIVSNDKSVSVSVAGDVTLKSVSGKILIGTGEESLKANQDGVLTPNTIFGGSTKVDTFTGMPFVGSTKVGSS